MRVSFSLCFLFFSSFSMLLCPLIDLLLTRICSCCLPGQGAYGKRKRFYEGFDFDAADNTTGEKRMRGDRNTYRDAMRCDAMGCDSMRSVD